jgi:hypothetical protein
MSVSATDRVGSGGFPLRGLRDQPTPRAPPARFARALVARRGPSREAERSERGGVAGGGRRVWRGRAKRAGWEWVWRGRRAKRTL